MTWYSEHNLPTRRAWLVQGSSVGGVDLVPDWLAGGYCSLAASHLGEITAGQSKAVVEAAARAAYDHLEGDELKTRIDEILAFVNKMTAGDVVITTSGGQAYVGDVTGPWTWQAPEEGAPTWVVRWSGAMPTTPSTTRRSPLRCRPRWCLTTRSWT